MAKFLLTDAKIVVNGVDLSDHAFSLDTPQTRDRVDVSGFNSTGAKEFLPGSTEETITIGFLQDFAASKVHQTLNPLYQNSSTFSLVIQPTSAAISSTNPALFGTAAMFTYNGLSGDISNRAEISVEFSSADPTAPLKWASA